MLDNVIGLPQTVLAPAGAGAFRTPKGTPVEKKDFMYFSGNVGTDDTSRVKQKEDEMNKAAAEATKRIQKEDEAQIRDRIDHIDGKRKKDSAYKAAKEAGEANLQSKEGVKEQYQKWTDKVDKTGEPAYNRLRDAESSAKEKDYDWAKKAEPSKHRESGKGFVDKVKEKVQHVMGKK
jgi:hypothetical protein